RHVGGGDLDVADLPVAVVGHVTLLGGGRQSKLWYSLRPITRVPPGIRFRQPDARRGELRTKRLKEGAPALSKAERTSRRKRLVRLAERLPETKASLQSGHLHMSLEVRGKRFGWLLDDHQGDGRLALNCKGPPGANKMLVSANPELFHLPRYLWHRGWI